MYGTIAKLKVKPGALSEIKKMESERIPRGYIGSYVFQSDNIEDEMWLVALFDNKANYLENAASSDQDQEYQKMRALLTADPEWHDGEIIFASEVMQQPC